MNKYKICRFGLLKFERDLQAYKMIQIHEGRIPEFITDYGNIVYDSEEKCFEAEDDESAKLIYEIGGYE